MTNQENFFNNLNFANNPMNNVGQAQSMNNYQRANVSSNATMTGPGKY